MLPLTITTLKRSLEHFVASSLDADPTTSRDMPEKLHVHEYGWTAVPRNRSTVPSKDDCNTTTATVDFEAIWPNSEVVKKAEEWVQSRLPQETWNHSLRVYCFGTQAAGLTSFI